MRYFILLPVVLLFYNCSFRPTTKHDVFKEKAEFPKEERIHDRNSVEWWYLTGHLKDEKSQKEYGVEYVFFHFNPLGIKDYLMGNLAICNPTDSSFHYDHIYLAQKRLDTTGPLSLSIKHKIRDWSFKGEEGNYAVQANMKKEQYGIKLKTKPIKSVAMYRNTGYEEYGAKGKAGYYSYPRLETKGQLQINGEWVDVEGTLWYDRQWNCGSVTETKVGWDWISIQLDNGEDLMAYRVFKKNKDEFIYSGALIGKDGSVQHFDGDKIKLTPLDTWKSPNSKKEYPVKWKVEIPEKNYSMVVSAVLPEQELTLAFLKVWKFRYWEGMCRVQANLNGVETKGKAYLEMTNH
ncbi:MAG: lipocalin family protein [Cyclobacteriaceae bacterium]